MSWWGSDKINVKELIIVWLKEIWVNNLNIVVEVKLVTTGNSSVNQDFNMIKDTMNGLGRGLLYCLTEITRLCILYHLTFLLFFKLVFKDRCYFYVASFIVLLYLPIPLTFIKSVFEESTLLRTKALRLVLNEVLLYFCLLQRSVIVVEGAQF